MTLHFSHNVSHDVRFCLFVCFLGIYAFGTDDDDDDDDDDDEDFLVIYIIWIMFFECPIVFLECVV